MGYNNLAALLVRLGRTREGEQLFRAALERDPHSSAALLGLGETLAALQNYVKQHKRMRIIELFGTIDYHPNYDYKAARYRRTK